MVTGSCLCGKTRWRVAGQLGKMTHCHCSKCRKAHGAAFGTYVYATREAFEWVQGREDVANYESSCGFIRSFCLTCGSVVPEANTKPKVAMPAGCLDDDPGVKPSAHIFASSKASWHHITDDITLYQAYVDDGVTAVIDEEPGPICQDKRISGSCLCGEVTFQVTEPVISSWNCHCGRCRKAHGAAFSSLGFTSSTAITFLTGADFIKAFKVPDAQIYTNSFCRRCGSILPTVYNSEGFSCVPFGSLDESSDLEPTHHTYTSDMAVWHTISDELPKIRKQLL